MIIRFSKIADKQLHDWITSDRSVAKKIYELIEDIKINGLIYGKGKPEQLKYYKDPVRFSRRITQSDRLVYSPVDDDILLIISCKGHYED